MVLAGLTACSSAGPTPDPDAGGPALVTVPGALPQPDQRLHRAEELFRHYGGKIVAVARFIEGLRQLNGIVAVLLHWRRRRHRNSRARDDSSVTRGEE